MKRGPLFALAVIYALILTCMTLCRCVAILNGTAAEDPKCWVGPCAPGQHDDDACDAGDSE